MSGYSTTEGQRTMHFDAIRNAAYKKAITELVTPQSVVMDLGCGLGIHGLNAARAGARQVILVEPEPVIEMAGNFARANGFDNVQLIKSRVEQVQLETPVDLIISVFTGNFLLCEDLLPSLFLARDRFLAPGGRLLPDRARMIAAPVAAPAWYDEHIDCWSASSSAGFDFSAARRLAANSVYPDHPGSFSAEFLAEPAPLMELDFQTANEAGCDCSIDFIALGHGLLHGWLGWFDMRLGQDWFSTSPGAPSTHWGQVMLPLEKPVQINRGERLNLQLRRAERGHWHWHTRRGSDSWQNSSFFAEPLSGSRLAKQSEDYRPELNNEGQMLTQALSMMADGHSARGIAEYVHRAWPGQFANFSGALERVKLLIDRYG